MAMRFLELHEAVLDFQRERAQLVDLAAQPPHGGGVLSQQLDLGVKCNLLAVQVGLEGGEMLERGLRLGVEVDHAEFALKGDQRVLRRRPVLLDGGQPLLPGRPCAPARAPASTRAPCRGAAAPRTAGRRRPAPDGSDRRRCFRACQAPDGYSAGCGSVSDGPCAVAGYLPPAVRRRQGDGRLRQPLGVPGGTRDRKHSTIALTRLPRLTARARRSNYGRRSTSRTRASASARRQLHLAVTAKPEILDKCPIRRFTILQRFQRARASAAERRYGIMPKFGRTSRSATAAPSERACMSTRASR